MNKILIVDDEEDLRKLLKDYFELNGYLVQTAKDGDEALRQVERQPDLVLLDVDMPGMNGLDVCRKIRGFVSCPILFLTAYVEETDQISGFQAGVPIAASRSILVADPNLSMILHSPMLYYR